MKLDGKNERHVIARRADRLRQLSSERYLDCARAQVGTAKKVLLLKNGNGFSRDYWNVALGGDGFSGEEIRVQIKGLVEDRLGRHDILLDAQVVG
jgi:threonylcarbamoyladenosine tRNA methylthiotransferase MtaB